MVHLLESRGDSTLGRIEGHRQEKEHSRESYDQKQYQLVGLAVANGHNPAGYADHAYCCYDGEYTISEHQVRPRACVGNPCSWPARFQYCSRDYIGNKAHQRNQKSPKNNLKPAQPPGLSRSAHAAPALRTLLFFLGRLVVARDTPADFLHWECLL